MYSLPWYMYSRHLPTVLQIVENIVYVPGYMYDMYDMYSYRSICFPSEQFLHVRTYYGKIRGIVLLKFLVKLCHKDGIERSKKQSSESSSCVSFSFPFCKKKNTTQTPRGAIVKSKDLSFDEGSRANNRRKCFQLLYHSTGSTIATNNGMDWYFFST